MARLHHSAVTLLRHTTNRIKTINSTTKETKTIIMTRIKTMSTRRTKDPLITREEIMFRMWDTTSKNST